MSFNEIYNNESFDKFKLGNKNEKYQDSNVILGSGNYKIEYIKS